MTLSPERISELKELAGKATPGPWRRASGTANYRVYGQFREVASAYQVKHGTRAGDVLVEADGRANASYIAAIDPATLLALLEEVEGLRKALALASNKFAFAAGLSDPTNKNMFLQGAKRFCDEALGATP